jgi:hypothetical protein
MPGLSDLHRGAGLVTATVFQIEKSELGRFFAAFEFERPVFYL